ncbi:Rid family hydrolase [Roseibium sp. HPY-6]|uniref:RidA family protein n=1 Tax=Roseibium sp. HPY-6 TaxID=3229852 RepID=UPI00338FDF58
MREKVSLPKTDKLLAKLKTPTSILVRSHGTLYSCGVPPIDLENGTLVEGSVESQAEAVLALMKQALEEAGSSMSKVIKTTIFVTDTSHFGPVNEVYKKHFEEPYPVRSFIAVKPWSINMDIEIECIAEC